MPPLLSRPPGLWYVRGDKRRTNANVPTVAGEGSARVFGLGTVWGEVPSRDAGQALRQGQGERGWSGLKPDPTGVKGLGIEQTGIVV